MTQTTKPNCCAGQCNYGPGCTKEIEALDRLANPQTESRSPMTNTTQKPHIFDPVSGEWFRVMPWRPPVKGDHLLSSMDGVKLAKCDYGPFAYRHILTPCSPPPLPQSKEVVELVKAAEEIAELRGIRFEGIDRWITVHGAAMSKLRNALAALTPEPQERYTVTQVVGATYIWWRVYDGDSAIARFDYEQDAKDFAAFKNEQEGEK